MEAVMEKQRALNDRVLARARTVLSTDQTLTFGKAQRQRLERQQMVLKMWQGVKGQPGPAK